MYQSVSNLIVVNRAVLERNRSGTVSACIWATIAGVRFPADGWDDFATAVLVALIRAIMRLAKRASTQESVRFFEGPFSLELVLVDSTRIRVSGVKKGDDTVVCAQEVSLFELAASCGQAAELLLSWCRPLAWISTDEQALENQLLELKREVLSKVQ